jgi:DNA-binding NarL/FixJ family response regulator
MDDMQRLRGPTVLIVDDGERERHALRLLLEEEQIRVVGEAGDGLEAVEKVERYRPDVVLMDLRMPLLDGIEATRQIMQFRPTTQVLILTMYDDPSLTKSAADVGAYAYLVKGCSTDFIVQMIMQAWKFKAGQELADSMAWPHP